MQISAPHPAPESTKLDWGPATWVFTGLQVILLLPMLENRCFTFFAISRVTLPSLVCQQCFLWPTEFSTFPSSIPSSAMELCGHKGPFSPVCVDRTLPPPLLFWPRVEITLPKPERQSGVTSISLSPDGEGSLLRLERPRSFPSEARGGRSTSPSFAGVEGPLCVLYSPGAGNRSEDISEARLSVSSRENISRLEPSPQVLGPRGSTEGKDLMGSELLRMVPPAACSSPFPPGARAH